MVLVCDAHHKKQFHHEDATRSRVQLRLHSETVPSSWDLEIALWNGERGGFPRRVSSALEKDDRRQLITELKGHPARTKGRCVFSNNTKVISTSDDNTLRSWDLAKKKVLSRTLTTSR